MSLQEEQVEERKEVEVFAPNIKQETFADLVSKYGCQLIQGFELWEETLSFTKILSTGCCNIDNLLDGGIFTGELTEIFGPPSSGKTQFAFTLAINVIQSCGFHALYVDTNCSISMKRIKEMLVTKKKENCSPVEMKEVLAKLRVVKVYDIFKLLTYLELLKEKLVSGVDQFALRLKLIVVDSIHSIISPILGGKQTQGHSLMMQLSLLLKELAYDYGIAVVVLNGTVTNSHDNTSSSKFKPALGKYWFCVPQTRLSIDFASVKDVSLRTLIIHRHSRLPVNKSRALFHIKNIGLSSDL